MEEEKEGDRDGQKGAQPRPGIMRQMALVAASMAGMLGAGCGTHDGKSHESRPEEAKTVEKREEDGKSDKPRPEEAKKRGEEGDDSGKIGKPLPPALREKFQGAEVREVDGVQVFNFLGTYYMVDPSDSKGNCLYRLTSGDQREMTGEIHRAWQRGGKAVGTVEHPYTSPVAIYLEKGKKGYAGRVEQTLISHFVPRLPDGQFVPGKDGKPMVPPEYQRTWTLTEGVTAQGLKEGVEEWKKIVNSAKGRVLVQKWRVVVDGEPKEADHFRDTDGREWILQFRTDGPVAPSRGSGGMMDVARIGDSAYVLFPDGGLWRTKEKK